MSAALDAPARIIAGRTFVPLRFVGESLGASVSWDPARRHVEITTEAAPPKGVRRFERQVQIDDRSHTVYGIEISPDAGLRPRVVLGDDRVGGIEELDALAVRHGAVVAINGGYFEAYSEPPEPWTTLISSGRMVHRGSIGSTIGFTADGGVKLAQLRVEIEGGSEGSYSWPHNWYAYGFNRTPVPGASSVYIFTPQRGPRLGFAHGAAVVVSGGRVQRIAIDEDVAIPGDGFVIHLSGSETYLLDRFQPGARVEYRLRYTDRRGGTLDWSDVVEAVGAGPTLVESGRLSVDPAGEGFFEDKVLTLAWTRAAIGIRGDGAVLLAVTRLATMDDLGRIMLELGAEQAMSLDGGASAGLWAEGRYLWQPGRQLSNALLFVPAGR